MKGINRAATVPILSDTVLLHSCPWSHCVTNVGMHMINHLGSKMENPGRKLPQNDKYFPTFPILGIQIIQSDHLKVAFFLYSLTSLTPVLFHLATCPSFDRFLWWSLSFSIFLFLVLAMPLGCCSSKDSCCRG